MTFTKMMQQLMKWKHLTYHLYQSMDFVSVKQGETLTDQEVLSKVNLPKDVEVIKVEKPTTSALGRLVA